MIPDFAMPYRRPQAQNIGVGSGAPFEPAPVLQLRCGIRSGRDILFRFGLEAVIVLDVGGHDVALGDMQALRLGKALVAQAIHRLGWYDGRHLRPLTELAVKDTFRLHPPRDMIVTKEQIDEFLDERNARGQTQPPYVKEGTVARSEENLGVTLEDGKRVTFRLVD